MLWNIYNNQKLKRLAIGWLDGGFNPFEKNLLVKMGIFPNFRDEHSKTIWNHHLVLVSYLHFELVELIGIPIEISPWPKNAHIGIPTAYSTCPKAKEGWPPDMWHNMLAKFQVRLVKLHQPVKLHKGLLMSLIFLLIMFVVDVFVVHQLNKTHTESQEGMDSYYCSSLKVVLQWNLAEKWMLCRQHGHVSRAKGDNVIRESWSWFSAVVGETSTPIL